MPGNSKLVLYPDPRLRQRAEPVTAFERDLLETIKAIKQAMVEHGAIGLSASHLGIPQRIVLVGDEPYINPELSDPSEETAFGEEGSISLPGIRTQIERPIAITVTAQDIHGQSFTRRLENMDARILMHENDQLNGVFFLDRAPRRERQRLKSILKKRAKQR